MLPCQYVPWFTFGSNRLQALLAAIDQLSDPSESSGAQATEDDLERDSGGAIVLLGMTGIALYVMPILKKSANQRRRAFTNSHSGRDRCG